MLNARMSLLARSPRLLVAADFDGTISPLVSVPMAARGDARCVASLARLARMECTGVAVISGRPLGWLREAVGEIPGVLLFGSHGAEDASLPPLECGVSVEAELARVAEQLEGVAARWAGCLVERKPLGATLHYRLAAEGAASDIVNEVWAISAMHPQFVVRHGLKVIELCASARHKGEALERAKYLSGATHAVFVGDDVTDEDAFAALGPGDLAIKVGAGESRAEIRVGGVGEVAEALETLERERGAWLRGRGLVPIQQHSILSDQRTAAVVSASARVVWLCLPRLDSPSMFAEVLDGAKGGSFAIEPEDGSAPTGQAYVGDSMLLRTQWAEFSVTDYLDCSGGRAYQRAGRSDLVRAIEGRGRVRVTFAPRLDFGRMVTRLRIGDEGVEVESGGDACVLRAPGVCWTIVEDGVHQTAVGVVDLDGVGGAVALELRFGTANTRAGVLPESRRRGDTQRHWSGWAGALRVPPEFRDVLVRSALTIKALCNGPSGAIAAAGTTSLPEQLGGIRNWDYRYCWPRDAAMAATALVRLGNTGHAMKMTEWLVGVVDELESPERLRPIYTVSGEELGTEAEISGLNGYAESRPVRVGNAAAQQVQLDVFGPIAHMVASMTEQGVPVSPDAWRLVRAMVSAVEARWAEPDHGIWEIRCPKRHHVYSKVMCWHAIDRALVVHDAVLGRESVEWRGLRDRIGAEVLERGWNAELGSFTGSYGSSELDASVLATGLCGLLKPGDERWASTVSAIEKGLRAGAAVYRYRGDDGLAGSEGGFVICACWLIEALMTLGREVEARRLLEEVLAQAGATGLFAEQWDPSHGTALGNFPQVYSHVGVINAVLSVARGVGGPPSAR